MKRIPEAELQLMLCIWKAKEPVCRTDLEDQLKEQQWAAPTIMTMLTRLVNKGFLSMEKRGNVNYYTPLITEEDYAAYEGKTLMQRFFDNSLKNMAVCMTKNRQVTKEELEELRAFLDALKKDQSDS